MRILCCGADTAQMVQTSSNDFTPRCNCDLSYEEIVDDVLPKYAFCRILTFKFAMFRSTLYELLPLSQKKEFHIRAVEYLENEPVICISCDRPRWVYEVTIFFIHYLNFNFLRGTKCFNTIRWNLQKIFLRIIWVKWLLKRTQQGEAHYLVVIRKQCLNH